MKAPVTNKSLGINKPYGSDVKFRDVRAKAKNEEEMRHKKAKRDRTIKLPKFKIGDEIVLNSVWSSLHFHLAEVIDIDEGQNRNRGFYYFAILKKTTDPQLVKRIGRLIYFSEGGWWRTDFCPANVENKHIRWSTVSVD
jgi:hypothetical protein